LDRTADFLQRVVRIEHAQSLSSDVNRLLAEFFSRHIGNPPAVKLEFKGVPSG
jgi:hypothetical protein